MALDYIFTQKLSNFGRKLAGDIVGQPFIVHRLSAQSQGDVIAAPNIVNPDLRAKVTHGRPISQLENEYLHTNLFQFLMSSDDVAIGDILRQNDPAYGGDTDYCVASRRPLKNVMCVRVESACKLYRPQSNKEKGYGGPTKDTWRPFVVVDGVVTIGDPEVDTASIIPCGVQNIGQMKNFKPEKLPMGTITAWWYIYVPPFPGIEKMRENDIIEVTNDAPEARSLYRINTPYFSSVGTAGMFALCERIVV